METDEGTGGGLNAVRRALSPAINVQLLQELRHSRHLSLIALALLRMLPPRSLLAVAKCGLKLLPRQAGRTRPRRRRHSGRQPTAARHASSKAPAHYPSHSRLRWFCEEARALSLQVQLRE